MLMGRFLLQIYIFPRHEQNICCFFFVFAYGLLLGKQILTFTIMCIYSGFLVPISSDRNKRYHASAPHGTIRPLQRYTIERYFCFHIGEWFANSTLETIRKNLCSTTGRHKIEVNEKIVSDKCGLL